MLPLYVNAWHPRSAIFPTLKGLIVPTWTIRRIAREAGWEDLEAAAVALMDGGFEMVSGTGSRLDRRDAARARSYLMSLAAPAQEPEARPKRIYAEPAWPRAKAGSRIDIAYLTAEEIRDIHEALVDEFSGSEDAVAPPGVRDEGALEGAVDKPQTLADEKYHSVPLAASALVHSLVLNHPFHNGNKRTGLLALAIFLEKKNGWYIRDGAAEVLYDLVVATARHGLVPPTESEGAPMDPFYSDREMLAIQAEINRIASKPGSGNKALQWRRLEATLRRLGCEVDPLRSNKTKIRRILDNGRTLQTGAGAANAGDEIDAPTIAQIRKDLELTEEHGCDYAVFYDGQTPHPPLPQLIQRYRGVLERLALLDRTG